MLRFCKPDGNPFHLDYFGTVQCRDAGGDIIAVCDGSLAIEDALAKLEGRSKPERETPDPYQWDNWRVLVEGNEQVIQRMIVAAYAASEALQRMLYEHPKHPH